MDRLRDLAEDLIGREERTPAPFGLYIVPSADPAAELARDVERVVFKEFFDNSPELLDEEYAPYDAGSVFFVVLDHALRTPAGSMNSTFSATQVFLSTSARTVR